MTFLTNCVTIHAAQVCGYPERRTCAVVDAHYIVHLDKRTASAQLYHNLTYEDVRMCM